MSTSDSDAGGVSIAADQFKTLMETITASQTKLDAKLETFSEQMRRTQEDVAMKAVKRAKTGLEKPYKFKKKGNEEQALFNSHVEDKLQEAQAELGGKATPTVIDQARSHLEEGLKMIAERQKLIKLANRSEFGWGVVVEYTADELADNSDDKKKIEKAEMAAERKAAKKKAAQKVPTMKRAMQVPQSPAILRWQNKTPRRQIIVPSAKNMRPVGPCFSCGEMGHLRSYCPKPEVGAKKMYPLCPEGGDVSSGSHSTECSAVIDTR